MSRGLDRRGVEGQIEGRIVLALGQSPKDGDSAVNHNASTPGLVRSLLLAAHGALEIPSMDPRRGGGGRLVRRQGIGAAAMAPKIPAIMSAFCEVVGRRSRRVRHARTRALRPSATMDMAGA